MALPSSAEHQQKWQLPTPWTRRPVAVRLVAPRRLHCALNSARAALGLRSVSGTAYSLCSPSGVRWVASRLQNAGPGSQQAHQAGHQHLRALSSPQCLPSAVQGQGHGRGGEWAGWWERGQPSGAPLSQIWCSRSSQLSKRDFRWVKFTARKQCSLGLSVGEARLRRSVP